jgi:hypothetical protein
MVQCSCGEQFEIPPIRKLRNLEPAADEPLPPLWTKRQGLLFLGSLITICSIGFAAVLWLNMPAPFIPPTVNFDRTAVEKEVAALTPAESFRRLALIQRRFPSPFEKRLHERAVPSFLLLSEGPLLEFEGIGAGPMAPKQMAVIQKETSKYTAQLIANMSVRRTLSQWLWLAGGVCVGGILIACSSLLIRNGKSSRRRQRATQMA